MPGGEAYVDEAKRNGAVDIIRADRKTMAILANAEYDDPSKKCVVIGITGSNGKTSIAYFVNQLLTFWGQTPTVQGTLNSPLTTPESLDTIKHIARHVKNKGSHFIMEVSSHAIDQGRIEGINFDIKLLSNITSDHLDYHLTLEKYRACKLSFMTDYPGKSIYPNDFLSLDINTPAQLYGEFNLENVKAAAAICLACGMEMSMICQAIHHLSAPPGRCEAIDESQPFSVVVDFAHTEDGLEKLLIEARKIAKRVEGRVLTLFGCGGDRDKFKRPKMGAVAHRLSDLIVITADNPRSEKQSDIASDIVSGIPKNAQYRLIEDRKEAIRYIISCAKENDVVIVAGKGDERTQVIGDTTYVHDDREWCKIEIHRWLKESHA